MVTIEQELKKRSKRLKTANKKMYKGMNKKLKEPWKIKGKSLVLLEEAISAVSKGELPKFSKKQAKQFQHLVFPIVELGAKEILIVQQY